MKKWTVGMPSYNNMAEVWFTVQSLRMHHDLTDCEILIIDNFGDDNLYNFVKNSGGNTVKYERFTEITGVSAAKNKIFEVASGENVLVIDSHILMKPGTLDHVPPGDDMIQGPLLQSNAQYYWIEWKKKWRKQMWGVWGDLHFALPEKPKEIWAMGAGFFACRRDSWLGFNDDFRGFGGETGYIQEKYRQAGRKVWMYPNMVWSHLFGTQGRAIPYPLHIRDRVRNYIIGFDELNLDLGEIEQEFGSIIFRQCMEEIKSGEVFKIEKNIH